MEPSSSDHQAWTRRRESGPPRRLALLLEYEGTRYKGFQRQVRAPTIQEEVERAIKGLTGETTRIRGASRTDAGAHARGQVAEFLTHAPYKTESFVSALNWYLPPDIRVRGARETPLEFNARKDALSRVYRYTTLNTRWPSALARGFSNWVSGHLDVAGMGEAASHLRGTHDFRALVPSLPPQRSAVRRVERWDVWREDETVLIEAEANGFLPHQVRRTNGLLVEIGLGKLPVDTFKSIVEGGLKELRSCPSLPAKGLCLMRANYPELGFWDKESHEAR